eukprot:14451376-Alexandrium_andersonii.AAC.1
MCAKRGRKTTASDELLTLQYHRDGSEGEVRKYWTREIWKQRKADGRKRLSEEMDRVIADHSSVRWGKRAKRLPGDPQLVQ